MKKRFPILLALLLLLCAVFAANCFAADDTVVLDNCDNANGWLNGPKLNRDIFTEGKGSVSFTVSKRTDSFVVYKQYSKTVDASAMSALEFDIYFSNAQLVTSNSYFALEITSGGTWDVQEIEWSDSLRYQEYEDGWNHVVLYFSENSSSDINLSAINFLRIFMLGIYDVEENITVAFDNFVFTQSTVSGDAVEAAPSDTAPELAATVPVTAEVIETAAPETETMASTDATTGEAASESSVESASLRPALRLLSDLYLLSYLCLAFALSCSRSLKDPGGAEADTVYHSPPSVSRYQSYC